jgi:hypothetical protein
MLSSTRISVEAAGQHQQRLRALNVEMTQSHNHLLGAGAGDDPRCDRADTQRGQRRQRHVLVDARTSEKRSDHET